MRKHNSNMVNISLILVSHCLKICEQVMKVNDDENTIAGCCLRLQLSTVCIPEPDAGLTVACSATRSDAVMTANASPPCVGTDTAIESSGAGTRRRVSAIGALSDERVSEETRTWNRNCVRAIAHTYTHAKAQRIKSFREIPNT